MRFTQDPVYKAKNNTVKCREQLFEISLFGNPNAHQTCLMYKMYRKMLKQHAKEKWEQFFCESMGTFAWTMEVRQQNLENYERM